MTDGFFDRRGNCCPGRLTAWERRGPLCISSKRDGVLSAQQPTHHPAKAKRAVQITLVGGLSHVDSFDPKPRTAPGGTAKRCSIEQTPDTFFDQIGLLRATTSSFAGAAGAGYGSRSCSRTSPSTPTN